MQAHVEHNESAAAWGQVGPICVVVWKGALEAALLDRFVAYANTFGPRHPSGWVVLSYPYPKIELPSQEIRNKINELTAQPGENYRGTTTVVDAEGFRASVMRSILAGMSLVGGKHAPRHVSKTTDEAVDYLATVVAFDAAAAKHEVHAFLTKVRA